MPEAKLRFDVRYPWGSSFCKQLQAALDEFGYATADNPLAEGAGVGFLVARNAGDIARGKALIEATTPALISAMEEEGDGWWEVFFQLRDQLREMGVLAIEYDSKHFEWEGNFLEDLGVALRLVSDRISDGEQRYLFEISGPRVAENRD